MANEQLELVDNEAAGRYEIHLDGRLAGFADYVRRGDVLAIPHTETSPEFGGRGLGSKLVKFGLDDIRARGLRVQPSCSFVAAYIAKNPEYADLVAS